MKPTLLVLSLVTVISRSGLAQAPGQPGEDPLARYLYPPDFVFDHQQAIGLNDAIRQKIQDAVIEAQKKFMGLQFAMSKQTETLKGLLQPGNVNEDAVLKQTDQMLGIEREVKRIQLSLMIKIKNALTAEQQEMLKKIREQSDGLSGLVPPQRGGEEPLVYIDGVQAPQIILKALDPHRIAMVGVLQANAAIERYGPKGVHGVIIVTLKP